MAPEDQTNAPTDETPDSGDQVTVPPAGETSKVEAPKPETDAVKIDDSTKLPETHPLVKTLAANKEKLSSQARELTEARAKTAQVTKLEEELAARPPQEAVDTLQTRYDRLEAFLVAAGGPIGKALDSRTFTRDLFETDKDIDDLVRDWHKANPSATSQALGSGGAAPAEGKVDANKLIRAAYNGGR